MALTPIGFLLGGTIEISDRNALAANYFLLIGAIYMLFYCLLRIEKGSIKLLGGAHILIRKEEPVIFWLYTSMLMFLFSKIIVITLPRLLLVQMVA